MLLRGSRCIAAPRAIRVKHSARTAAGARSLPKTPHLKLRSARSAFAASDLREQSRHAACADASQMRRLILSARVSKT
jgi:hypothetical protein